MFINLIGPVGMVVGWSSFFSQGNALEFLRTYCNPDDKTIVFLGLEAEEPLNSVVAVLREEGYRVELRQPEPGKTLASLVTLGEFAKASLVVGRRDLAFLFAALKGIGLVYQQQEGGLASFDADATILAGFGDDDETMRLSREAHLLVEARAAIPVLPESMADFTNYLWGRLFDYFISSFERRVEALRSLENFPRVEGLAAKAVEVAGGIWVVDARESPTPDFRGLMEAMEHLPQPVVALVRQRGLASTDGKPPKLGIAFVDQERRKADFDAFAAEGLSPELADILKASPDLDMADTAWDLTVVPAFRRMFGPPTH